jgi:hypothetical protein
MPKRNRRNHAPEFKVKVALAAVRNEVRSPSWRNGLMFILRRSRRGRTSCWRAPRVSSRPVARRRPHRRM